MPIKSLTQKLLPALLLTGAATGASAADISVSVTNLTYGMHFTPLFVAAHDEQFKLFDLGMPASAELEAMAEGGDTSGLMELAMSYSAEVGSNGAPLAPGMMSTDVELATNDNMYLSVGSMLLPTNDAFLALNAWMIPTEAGTYTLTVNAYDSGTEANSEVIGEGDDAIPMPPFVTTGGENATGVDASPEGFVHVHRGGLGDDDLTGGASDLDNRVHRWVGPVARITVVVK